MNTSILDSLFNKNIYELRVYNSFLSDAKADISVSLPRKFLTVHEINSNDTLVVDFKDGNTYTRCMTGIGSNIDIPIFPIITSPSILHFRYSDYVNYTTRNIQNKVQDIIKEENRIFLLLIEALLNNTPSQVIRDNNFDEVSLFELNNIFHSKNMKIDTLLMHPMTLDYNPNLRYFHLSENNKKFSIFGANIELSSDIPKNRIIALNLNNLGIMPVLDDISVKSNNFNPKDIGTFTVQLIEQIGMALTDQHAVACLDINK